MSQEQTVSWWRSREPVTPAAALDGRESADVCVVGAGIAGLTTALLLAREGRDVVVLDAGEPGDGETARTTAHLASEIDDRLYNLIRWHGREGARVAVQSHGAAIDQIETLAREVAPDCEFRRLDGYLFPAESQAHDHLAEESKAARELGLNATLLESLALPGTRITRALRFPRQAQFSPLRYLRGLRRALVALGGRIYGHTAVTEIDEGPVIHVHTDRKHSVLAHSVVVATNTPINNRVVLHTKQAPYRTYAVTLRMPRGSLEPALFWDTGDPYHYVRTTPGDDDSDMLIVGGEDHKTGQEHPTEEIFNRLATWARKYFPAAGEITHRWSGQVMETIDGLAYIGRNPGSGDNCYVATGDSGMGMTHGTIAGMLLTDLIQGRANGWEHVYRPNRMTLSAAAAFARENFNVARQYLDWGRPHQPAEAAAGLATGCGCVVQRGLHKVALYRDSLNGLHELSAVCPHLGCIVAWNETENTWDCPCHGSRFEPTGAVISGPATTPLGPAEPAPGDPPAAAASVLDPLPEVRAARD